MPKLREKNEYEQLNSKKMIREVKMYEAVCDRCGKSSRTKYKTRDFVDICVEVDENWVKINNLNYCPDCYEYDEETDEYKPKNKD